MRILTDIVVLPEDVMKSREQLTGSMDLYSSMPIVTVDFHVMAIRLTYADAIDALTDTARQFMNKL